MNIAAGLIRKGRLIQKLHTLHARLQTNNSVQLLGKDADPQRDYDPTTVVEEMNETRDELIDLKYKLEQSCLPIREKIFRLAELKTELIVWQSLNTKDGEFKGVRSRFSSDEPVENEFFHATFDVHDVEEATNSILEEIDTLQTEINSFNLTTQIV